MCAEKRPCEDTVKRWLSSCQGEFPENNTAGTLILEFLPSELWGNKFLLLKSPSLWYFVLAVLADEYSGISFTCSWKPSYWYRNQSKCSYYRPKQRTEFELAFNSLPPHAHVHAHSHTSSLCWGCLLLFPRASCVILSTWQALYTCLLNTFLKRMCLAIFRETEWSN